MACCCMAWEEERELEEQRVEGAEEREGTAAALLEGEGQVVRLVRAAGRAVGWRREAAGRLRCCRPGRRRSGGGRWLGCCSC